ncbi:MAG: ribbon-helix-helix protein, CopG family [Desulfurococcales archaeon]|nr:ribbon-helix-helix protein, CopG family [Desulfurococcales archaeon]MEB3806687.1 ribbon-helix-helix protein, CopG family [Desulfurococcales archaeon]
MRVVSFKVEEDLLEVLEEYARRKRISKSELIRRALRNFISETEERPYITRRVRVY